MNYTITISCDYIKISYLNSKRIKRVSCPPDIYPSPEFTNSDIIMNDASPTSVTIQTNAPQETIDWDTIIIDASPTLDTIQTNAPQETTDSDTYMIDTTLEKGYYKVWLSDQH